MTGQQNQDFSVLCQVARELFAEHGMIGKEVLVILTARAQQLGLDGDAVERAIRSLDSPASPITDPRVRVVDSSVPDKRWQTLNDAHANQDDIPMAVLVTKDNDIPTAPSVVQTRQSSPPDRHEPKTKEKEPKPAPKARDVLFTEMLNKRLVSKANMQLLPDTLERLLDFGVRQAGLSRVYAEDLIVEVCDQNSIIIVNNDQTKDDPATLTFASYCKQVLTTEGGVTRQFEVKTDARAKELQLSHQQRDRALELVQTPSIDRVARRTGAYESFLQRSLPKHKSVGPNLALELEAIGVERFGLQTEKVGRFVRAVAKDLSIPLRTRQAALAFFARSVKMAIDGNNSLPRLAKEELLSEAKRLELSQEDARNQIDQQLELNRQETRSVRRMDAWLLRALVAVAVLSVAMVGYITMSRKPAVDVATKSEPSEAAGIRSPDWWTPKMLLSVATARDAVPSAEQELDRIRSTLAIDRRKGCASLVGRYCKMVDDAANLGPQEPIDSSSDSAQLEALRSVVIESYVVEQDLSVRESWRNEFFAALATDAQLTIRQRAFEPLFHRISDVGEILSSSSADSVASAELETALNELLPDVPMFGGSAETIFERRLAVFLREKMTGQAQEMDLEFSNYVTLLAHAKRSLDPDAFDNFQRGLLDQELLSFSDSLGKFDSIIRARLMREDSTIATSWILSTFEKMTPGKARDELASTLLDIVSLPPMPNKSPERIAAAIRKQISVVPPQDSQSLSAAEWAPKSELIFNERLAGPDDIKTLALQLARFAHHFAEGEASLNLERHPQGNGMAILSELEALSTFSPPTKTPPNNHGVSSSNQRLIEQNVVAALNARPGYKNRYVERVFTYAPRVEDVSPVLAAQVIELVFSMQPQEMEPFAKRLQSLYRWRTFRIAFMDALTTRRSTSKRVLAQGFVGAEFDVSDQDWLNQIRLKILEDVRDDLKTRNAGQADSALMNALGDYVAKIFILKSRLRGRAPDPQGAGSTTPAGLLTAATKAYSAKLKTQTLSESADKLVDEANRRLKLAEFLANTDMAEVAVVQRAYLRLIAADLIHENAKLHNATLKLLMQLEMRDKVSKNLVSQVCDGELTGIRILMLRGTAQ